MVPSNLGYDPVKVWDEEMETKTLGPNQNPTQREFGSNNSGIAIQTALEFSTQTAEHVEWIAPYVVAGAVTEVLGQIKLAGKTTWALGLCRAVVDGLLFMGKATLKTRVLYLTEQPPASFRQSLERADLLNRDDFYVMFFKDTRGAAWEYVADTAIAHCKANGARLLVVDTLSQFAGIKGDEENTAGAAMKAMRPLQMAAGDGIGAISIRHDRKSGGLVVASGRGSSAFSGAADVVLSIRRPEGNTSTTLRTIEAIGRFDGIPETLTMDYVDEQYVVTADVQAVAHGEARRGLLAAAPTTESTAIPITELRGQVSKTSARRACKELVAEGLLLEVANGKRSKSNPVRYYRPQPESGVNYSVQTSTKGFGELGSNPGGQNRPVQDLGGFD